MIERYRTNYAGWTKENPASERARQTTADPLLGTRRVTSHSDRYRKEHQRATGPPTHKTNRLDWEMIALWIFVVASFALFVLAGFILWAKCNGNSSS